jgi:hypothetical protein
MVEQQPAGGFRGAGIAFAQRCLAPCSQPSNIRAH